MTRLAGGYGRTQSEGLRVLGVIVRWVVIGVLVAQMIGMNNRLGELETEYEQHVDALDRACREQRLDCGTP